MQAWCLLLSLHCLDSLQFTVQSLLLLLLLLLVRLLVA
jgi:hypothetical protein